MSFRSSGGARFTKQGSRVPIETELYQRAMREQPEIFAKLNRELAAQAKLVAMGPPTCQNNPGTCLIFTYTDGSGRCLDDEAALTGDSNLCTALRLDGNRVQRAETGQCLDSSSDEDVETWCFYACHQGTNQQFVREGAQFCTAGTPKACFETKVFGS